MEQVNPWVLVAFNVVLGIASLFGAMWLRRMESDMRTLQQQQQTQTQQVHDRLNEKVDKNEFREFRQELRENFKEVFERMDVLRDRVADKADR